MLETFIVSMGCLKFEKLWWCDYQGYTRMCLHLVFSLKIVNEGCVWAGVILFVSLTISFVKLHNCVKNSIIQHRVCASVWVKNKRKIILSGQNFLIKYAKERKTRVALSHMWDMCIYYIGSHHEINSMGCSCWREEKITRKGAVPLKALHQIMIALVLKM